MRSLLILAPVLILPVTASAQNLLRNADLELPHDAPANPDLIDSWTLVEPNTDSLGNPVNSATFASFANHTPGGDRGLWLRSFEGGFGGDEPHTVDASLYQDIAARPGRAYTLSAWFLFEANHTSDASTLSIQFFDAAWAPLTTTSININDLNSYDAVWRSFGLVAVADPATAYARVRFDMTNGRTADINPQSAFVDDFRLIPSPGAASLLGLAALAALRRPRRTACEA